MPIALDGIRTCISGIRAHSASDCTTTAGTSRVSRIKHFRHSPVSSIAKQSCMKDSNSYLRDRDAKHLQGPPLSRTKRVKERECVCVTKKKSARRMASTTSDTGDTSSKQQQAQRKEINNKRKRPVSSVDHCHPYRRKKRREAIYLTYTCCSLPVSGPRSRQE